MKKFIATLVISCSSLYAIAQIPGDDLFVDPEMCRQEVKKEILIPNIGDYVTLKCDFHTHTVFSDGRVWPTERVDEAWITGLDVIAITEHIENRFFNRWFARDIDHNTSYHLARNAHDEVLVIPGTEISRNKPFGHMNALFITDANKADVKDSLAALDAMLEQGAYIIWNHPGWPDYDCRMYPIHKKLISEGKIHGVEVTNDVECYPVAYDWIEKYGLHPFSNSDIHGIIQSRFADIRPMTLVFATEKSIEGVKEALFAGRTLALFSNNLIGSQKYISQLVDACLDFDMIKDRNTFAVYRITNNSDIEFTIQLSDKVHSIRIKPRDFVTVDIVKGETLTFTNCFLGKNRHYSIKK